MQEVKRNMTLGEISLELLTFLGVILLVGRALFQDFLTKRK
jgi:hypothetical protein